MTFFLNRRTGDGRCPACGSAHAACGGTSETVGIDQRWEVAAVGGPLRKYRYTNGGGHETVLKLNAGDAEAYGLTDEDLAEDIARPAAVPAKISRPADTGRSGSANKARTASANKGGRKAAAPKAQAPPPGPQPPAEPPAPGDSGTAPEAGPDTPPAGDGSAANGGAGGGD